MKSAFLIVVLLLAMPGAVSGHRLDEYLQATRIDLAPGRVVLELNLTPGADVAPAIARAIDTDRDGEISMLEGRAYAQQVVADLALEVDGETRPLSLLRIESPSLSAMRDGTGTVRLEVGATLGSGDPGRHRLTFNNRHRRDVGVYLVNALLPRDTRITIADQHRDERQQGIRLDYDVSSAAARWPSRWLIVSGLGLFASLLRLVQKMD